ncbi:hypothetical protein [Litorimonas sp.]|uniref:hypothetical protein n=1 Tax=Litorimonas sp. TaxID=1892381 RepID=UPI003A8B437E
MTERKVGKLTEIDLEMQQREKLLESFSLLQTYDDREMIIAQCEKLVSKQTRQNDE